MEYLEGAVGAISSMIMGEQGTKGEWEKENRFKSFASERENCHVKWYVDGKDYFHAVSEVLMSAKEEIFIEDWWLSPELVCSISTAKFSYLGAVSRDISHDDILNSIFVDLLSTTKNIVLIVFLKRKRK